MRRGGLIGALVLVVLVNATVLAGVAWNRSGQPDATLRLTERELPLQYSFYRAEEDSGLALQLTLSEGSRAPDWLDADKLAALGFQPEPPGSEPATGRAGIKQALPRRAWVVLEFDGPAWQAALAARQQSLAAFDEKIAAGDATSQQRELGQQQLERMRVNGSRLVAVDAGADAAALRSRYPDRARYLITRAELRMRLSQPHASQRGAEAPVVRGYIRQLLPGRLHVPLQHRAALGGALPERRGRDAASPRAPRYAAVVNYGARREPWVEEIVALNKDTANP